MNKAIITGRITKDLELRETKKGTKVCEFTLATNRPTMRDGKREADFINCIVWNSQAETLVKYQKKGNLIAVFGEIRTESYEVNGTKKYKTYIMVTNLEFLESKPKESNPYEEFGNSIKTEVQQQFEYSEDDYPF